MMENYLLMKKSPEAEELSKELGFDRTYFLDEDLVLIEEKDEKRIRKKNNKKDLLKRIKSSKKKGKRVLVRVFSEDILRFILEKTPADLVLGAEGIHEKDSVHFLRSGLDQILCRIAHDRRKTIAFSFADVLHSSDQAKLLARMKFNAKLCRKYKVKMLLSNFSVSLTTMRSAKELGAWGRVLGIN